MANQRQCEVGEEVGRMNLQHGQYCGKINVLKQKQMFFWYLHIMQQAERNILIFLSNARIILPHDNFVHDRTRNIHIVSILHLWLKYDFSMP